MAEGDVTTPVDPMAGKQQGQNHLYLVGQAHM